MRNYAHSKCQFLSWFGNLAVLGLNKSKEEVTDPEQRKSNHKRTKLFHIVVPLIWPKMVDLTKYFANRLFYVFKKDMNSNQVYCVWSIIWGSFTNYVDQFLTCFDHLPTYRGLSWTFGAPPTPCPRGHIKTWPPTTYVQYVPSFTAFTK